MELWVFLGGGFLLLILLAGRNGAFQQRHYGDRDGRGSFPQVAPPTTGLQVRDPRAQIDVGDRLGRR